MRTDGTPDDGYVLTDASYRGELLHEVLAALRQAFAARAVYPAVAAGGGG